MEAIEFIKNIAAVVGLILSLTTLFTLTTKAGRNLVKKVVLKNTQDLKKENEQQYASISELKAFITDLQNSVNELQNTMDAVREVSMQDCRNIIESIYQTYEPAQKIPLSKRKTADVTYRIYVDKFNGNSYAKLLYEEICKWEIVNNANLTL